MLNKNVFDKEVLKYCLLKCPSSQWLISYTVFLYFLLIESDDSVYRFFLHLLSSGNLSYIHEYICFQFVFKWNCLAKPTSPMISKELEKYRNVKSEYVYWNKIFWSQVKQGKKVLDNTTISLFSTYKVLKRRIREMTVAFPISAEVAAETSVFFSDIDSNYEKAALHYKRLDSITNNRMYIQNIYFKDYIKFDSQQSLFQVDENYQRIFSMRQNSPDMIQQSKRIHFNDSYLEENVYAYNVQKNSPRLKAMFDKFSFTYFGISIAIMFFVLVLIFSMGYIFINDFNEIAIQYKEYLFREKTILSFRSSLNSVQYTIHMLQYIIDHIRGSISPEEFFDFIWQSIQYSEIRLAAQKDLFFQNFSAEDFNITEEGIEFSRYFSIIHNSIKYYNSTSYEINGPERRQTLESLDNAVKQISVITGDIFTANGNQKKEFSSEKHKEIYKKNIFIILLILLLSIIACLLFVHALSIIKSTIMTTLQCIQPPIANLLSHQLEHLINTNFISSYEKKRYSQPQVITYFLIAVGFLLLYPIYKMIALYVELGETEQVIIAPPMLSPTTTSSHAYMIYALIDYHTKRVKRNFSRDFLDVSTDGLTESFLNLTYSEEIENQTDYFAVFQNWSKSKALAHNSFFAIPSLIFIFITINSVIQKIEIVNFLVTLLRSVPIKPALSSPALHSLLTGEDKEEMKRDLLAYPEFSEFFCSLSFNHHGKIIETFGDVNQIFGTNFETIYELQDALLHGAKDTFRQDILNFFEGISNIIEIQFESRELLIKKNNNLISIIDNTVNSMRINQKRTINRIENSISEHHKIISNIKDKPSLVIAVINSDSEKLDRVANAIQDFHLIGGKFHHSIFIAPAEVCGKERVDAAIDIIKSIDNNSGIVIHFMKSLDMSQNMRSFHPLWYIELIEEVIPLCYKCKTGCVHYSEDYIAAYS